MELEIIKKVDVMTVHGHLFLGGTSHGKIIPVHDKMAEWKVPVPVSHLPIEDRLFDYEMYVRTPVVTARRTYHVYTRLGANSQNLINDLTERQLTLLKMTWEQ